MQLRFLAINWTILYQGGYSLEIYMYIILIMNLLQLVSVCSRPTAVNLSDAATKLKEVIRKATATASDAQTVYQVCADIHILGMDTGNFRIPMRHWLCGLYGKLASLMGS